jgi:hypothetical protein
VGGCWGRGDVGNTVVTARVFISLNGTPVSSCSNTGSIFFIHLQLDAKLWDKNNKRQRKNTREITTHTSIHTLHLDGLRELYRHFLRLPDGAIVEV